MDFYDDKGSHIDGLSLQLVYRDSSVIGLRTKGKFIQRAYCNGMGWTVESLKSYIGKTVDLELDIKGHVLGIKSTDDKLSG